MNLLSLQQEIGRLLGDSTNDRWSASTLTTRINLAQVEIQGYTNAVKTNENVSVTAGVNSANLNANVMDVIYATKVKTDGSRVPFQAISRYELDFMYPDWQQWPAGDLVFFYYDATQQQIILAPAPDSTISLIILGESRKPADLVNATDVPFDSNNQMIPYHIAICYWVVAECFMDDGTPESLVKSKFHKSGNMLHPGQYENQLGRIMAEFDVPEIVPSHVLVRPQGGRIGNYNVPSKSNPIPWS